jgi:hypothetical protein
MHYPFQCLPEALWCCPAPGEASKDKAAPKDKASKEGEGSANVAGSRNQALPQGTDPASLKALHEEEIRLGDVGGTSGGCTGPLFEL